MDFFGRGDWKLFVEQFWNSLKNERVEVSIDGVRDMEFCEKENTKLNGFRVRKLFESVNETSF